jgi:hypothetical protein
VDPAAGRGFHPFFIIAGVCGAALLLFLLIGEPAKLVRSWRSKAPSAKASVEKPGRYSAVRSREPEKKEPAPAAAAPDAVSQWLNSVSLGNFPKLNRKALLTLEVKAIDAVWVHITSDGSVIYQGVLKKGAGDQWSAKNTLEIWTGNASNMALTLNKYPLGSPGKGVVKKMIISHEGIRIVSPA